MSSLEKRYRLLVKALYPATHRAAREEEMVATLLDVAQPEQIDPNGREVIGLILGGLRARGLLALRRGWSSIIGDAVRLGTLFLLGSMLANFAIVIAMPDVLWRDRILPILMALAMVAVVRGTSRIALALMALLMFFGWRTLFWSWIMSDVPLIDHLEYNVVALTAVVAGLAWHAIFGGVRRPWSWTAAVIAVAVPCVFLVAPPYDIVQRLTDITGVHIPLSLITLIVPVMLLSALSVLGNDPRPSLAAAMYTVVNVIAIGPYGATTQYLALLAGLMVITIATGTLSIRRLAGSKA